MHRFAISWLLWRWRVDACSSAKIMQSNGATQQFSVGYQIHLITILLFVSFFGCLVLYWHNLAGCEARQTSNVFRVCRKPG